MDKGQILDELRGQAAHNVDVVASHRQISMRTIECDLVVNSGPAYRLTRHAETQLATKLGIPQKYYDMCKQDMPSLLAVNVNTWLGVSDTQALFLRLTEEKEFTARAVLSSSYKPIDDLPLYEAVLGELDEWRIDEYDMGEKRSYLRAYSPEEFDTPSGPARIGVVITNSEVGVGRGAVQPIVQIQVCSNGMVSDVKFAKTHLGPRMMPGLSNEAAQAAGHAAILELRDRVRSLVTGELWMAELLQRATEAQHRVVRNPVLAAENAAKLMKLPKTEVDAVLGAYSNEASKSLWGLLMAATSVASRQEDADTRYDMQQRAWKVVDMTPAQLGAVA